MIAILYFLLFFVLWLGFRKNAKGSVGELLLLFYLVSAFLSLLIEFSDTFEKPAELDLSSILYYVACVLISLFPFLLLSKYDSRNFYFPSQLMNYVTYFIIVFGLIELVSSTAELYSNRATIVSNIAALREGFYKILGESQNNTFLKKILIYVLPFQYMSPFCSMYYLSRGKKSLAVWAAVASLCVPVHGMTVGERQATLKFFSNYAFCYLFFRNEIPTTVKSRIKKIGIFGMIPLAIFFITMTFGRFGGTSTGTFNSLLMYGGKQPYFFTYLYNDPNIVEQSFGGRYTFSYLFPLNERASNQLNNNISTDIYLNQFGGLPGSMFLDFGYWTIFVIFGFALAYYIMIKIASLRKDKFPFYLLFIFYFSYQVLFMNIFYYEFNYSIKIFLNVCFFVVTLLWPDKSASRSFK